MEAAADVVPHRRRRDPLREPAGDPGPGDAVGEAELDLRPAVVELAKPPATALVDPGHRRPGHVARLVELNDLDQPTGLYGADAEQHPVPGAEADRRLVADLPAGHAGHVVQDVRRVDDVVPDQLGPGGDDYRLVEPHPITG